MTQRSEQAEAQLDAAGRRTKQDIDPDVLDKIKAAFKNADVNGDGKIQQAELLGVLKRIIGSGVTEADLLRLFAAADKNHDGVIDYDEFLEWVFSTEPENEKAHQIIDGLETQPTPKVQKEVVAALDDAAKTEFNKLVGEFAGDMSSNIANEYVKRFPGSKWKKLKWPQKLEFAKEAIADFQAQQEFSDTIPLRYRDAISHHSAVEGCWSSKSWVDKLAIAQRLFPEIKDAVDADIAAKEKAAQEEEAAKLALAIETFLANYTMEAGDGLVLNKAGVEKVMARFSGRCSST